MNKTYVLALVAALAAVPLAYAHVDGTPYGLPKTYCEDATGDTYNHDYGPPANGAVLGLFADGSVPQFNGVGCTYDDLVADQWDGHLEWAAGGAALLACAEFCWDGTGGGSLGCWGTYPDHSQFPAIWVFDHVLSALGAGVTFEVGVDTTPSPCGDGAIDLSVTCVDHCVPPFPPGVDGAYYVFVTGTMGHVWST